ncbi:diacylglycerol lipase-alpha-like [Neocloeon triangulifer]|uniref:diacylglycerol lipase-alpha-like n=1 Tax=Neocloeon triangulifer TaxID=2078957 RepID=UPI00286F25FD|nr:diacylglycerol lipase-alpha-like [Neocloeon triangulifer]
MPGLVFLRRRWNVGSDDFVLPGIFLFLLHTVWAVLVVLVLSSESLWRAEDCVVLLRVHQGVFLGMLGVAMALELGIALVAARGTILDTRPREKIHLLLYARLVLFILELIWLVLGVVWLVQFYADCPVDSNRVLVLGLIVGNGCVLTSLLITILISYDATGRSWVELKKNQISAESRSGSVRHHSGVLRAYQDTWEKRCRLLFCSVSPSDSTANCFPDLAELLTDFFCDLDVVPSDVVAGLILLRKMQKSQRQRDSQEVGNETPKLVALDEPEESAQFRSVVHFMKFALGAYGWPMYVITHSACDTCRLCSKLRCSCCRRVPPSTSSAVLEDTSCLECNVAALRAQVEVGQVEVVFATYHVGIGQTAFFVALDFDRRAVVLSIRGTLSMADVLTDLNADAAPLPLHPPRDDWLAHKGMVQAAVYVRDKIKEEGILARAFDPSKGTDGFDLVVVGHSLGAGTAALVAILLREEYPDLRCYAYSPPGGLLSLTAAQYSKEFTISVVVGKDLVPRIGLRQMESLRADLIKAIKFSSDPKWRTLTGGMAFCCAPRPQEDEEASLDPEAVIMSETAHPTDSSIVLTLHQPLYLPGKIIHVVRKQQNEEGQIKKKSPKYEAFWTENTDFQRVLISPVMFKDHLADTVLEALEKVASDFLSSKPCESTSDLCTLAATN